MIDLSALMHAGFTEETAQEILRIGKDTEDLGYANATYHIARLALLPITEHMRLHLDGKIPPHDTDA